MFSVRYLMKNRSAFVSSYATVATKASITNEMQLVTVMFYVEYYTDVINR